jgi:hypothetical protein
MYRELGYWLLGTWVDSEVMAWVLREYEKEMALI